MRKRVSILLTAALALGACGHGKGAETETVSENITTQNCASAEQIAEAASVRQTNQIEFMALKDRYAAVMAYQDRWKETFVKLDKLMKNALSPDEAEVSSGSAEDVIRFNIDYVGGAMVLSLQNDQLFEPGKITLTEEGQNIVSLIVSVVSKAEQRPVSIESKTTATVENLKRSTDAQIQELSMKRAAAIMEYMKHEGINDGVLSAAAPDLQAGEEAMVRGATTIKIHPSPREYPRFPDSVK